MTDKQRPPRLQCAKCPWKTSTNPHDIPSGYSVAKHCALSDTIAIPGAVNIGSELRMMACHETKPGKELPCVGWLVNQLGPGNNIGLRLRVMSGKIDGNVRTVGPQHERLEDTLPKRKARPKKPAKAKPKKTTHIAPRSRRGYRGMGQYHTVGLCGKKADGKNSVCLNRHLSDCDDCKRIDAEMRAAALKPPLCAGGMA